MADEIRAYDPTMRERMASALQSGMEGLGVDRYKARKHSQTIMGGESSNLPGGMGVADHWVTDTDDGPRWRDTQVEVRGPAAAALEGGFYENWIETGGVVEPEVRQRLENIGVQIVASTPEEFDRHIKGELATWAKVAARLAAKPEKLWALGEMERTGGEPDV